MPWVMEALIEWLLLKLAVPWIDSVVIRESRITSSWGLAEVVPNQVRV
jgi:hypothetical protein